MAELCLPIAVATAFFSHSCRERDPGDGPRVVLGAPQSVVRSPAVTPPEPPLLRMPVPAGEIVLCAQANHEPPGSTHALPQNLFALDFSARHRDIVDIVAAAAGRVGYVFRDSGNELDAGGGYGNHVKVQHGAQIHTLYAHLDEVDVEVGDRVRSGDRLGTMGATGLSGDRHLHFGLHVGEGRGPEVTLSLPILQLVTWSAFDGDDFELRSSVTLQSGPSGNPWDGCLYGSENDGSEAAHLGQAPPALAASLDASWAALSAELDRRCALLEFAATAAYATPQAARARLEPLMAADPSDPIALYHRAVAVEMAERRWTAARRTLERARQQSTVPRYREIWLSAWIENQLGVLDSERHDTIGATRHFGRARRLMPTDAVAQFGDAVLAQR